MLSGASPSLALPILHLPPHLKAQKSKSGIKRCRKVTFTFNPPMSRRFVTINPAYCSILQLPAALSNLSLEDLLQPSLDLHDLESVDTHY
jgi:hypothetical protein